jgi:hypothetical protein
VPRLVKYSGKAVDAQGKTFTGVVGITFAIYKDQTDGAPLWLRPRTFRRMRRETIPLNWAQPSLRVWR